MTYEMYEDFIRTCRKWINLRIEIKGLKHLMKKANKDKKAELAEKLWKKQIKKQQTQYELMRHPYFRYLMKKYQPKEVWAMILKGGIPKVEDKVIICTLIGWCK